MPLKETDHELTSDEIFAVRLFGVLESIVLLQFIALEECSCTTRGNGLERPLEFSNCLSGCSTHNSLNRTQLSLCANQIKTRKLSGTIAQVNASSGRTTNGFFRLVKGLAVPSKPVRLRSRNWGASSTLWNFSKKTKSICRQIPTGRTSPSRTRTHYPVTYDVVGIWPAEHSHSSVTAHRDGPTSALASHLGVRLANWWERSPHR